MSETVQERLDRLALGSPIEPSGSRSHNWDRPGYRLRMLRRADQRLDWRPPSGWWIVPLIALGAAFWLAVFLLINMALGL
ncbi:hypothetical protein [Marinibacterium profundimaris]|uniref:hypothetical protein n=1 Tax=Marinibacterium profundimaris TaxID=1679460 RepID=UPI00117D9846|nr:hypothetical protein [Marinibacterium profundimaris]